MQFEQTYDRWKDKLQQLHTDSTHNVLELADRRDAWHRKLTGEDVIIGVLNTGILTKNTRFPGQSHTSGYCFAEAGINGT